MTIDIEIVRDYGDRRPCNVRHSPLEVGTRAYFDEVRVRKYFVEPHIPRFAQFPHWGGRNILELGCGIGIDTVSFALNGANVTAVDLSPKSLEIAQAQAQCYGVQDKIEFHEGNIESLSDFLKLRAFDLIYAFGVLHHTPVPARAIAEIQKFMHVDTLVKLMLYNRHSWKTLVSLANWRPGMPLGQVVAQHSEAQPRCPLARTYTHESVKGLLRDFDWIKIQTAFIFPYRVQDYIQHRLVKKWCWRVMPQGLFHWLERHIGWHLLIDAC